MQTYDGIILNKKVRYLDPAAIFEAKHASPKWMKDDDDHLKSFETKKAKQKERKRFHQEHKCCGLHIAYDDVMGRHGCHICSIPHPVSLISTTS